MGFNQSHLAVYPSDRDIVLDVLGFVRTGQKEDFPESSHVSAMLQSGWFIVVSQWSLQDLTDGESIQGLSMRYRVITGYVSGMEGTSGIACWEAGSKQWGIEYNSSKREALQTHGTLPPEFQIVCERNLNLGKEGLDRKWKLPPEIGEAITGFRFDLEARELGLELFEVLKPPAKPEKKSFLKRLFRIEGDQLRNADSLIRFHRMTDALELCRFPRIRKHPLVSA